jgi:hypothetical protein
MSLNKLKRKGSGLLFFLGSNERWKNDQKLISHQTFYKL